MSLQTALAAFKAHLSSAFDFADPHAFIVEKEAEFKEAVANEHTKLEERISQLETQVQQLLDHPAVSVPPIEPAPVNAAG